MTIKEIHVHRQKSDGQIAIHMYRMIIQESLAITLR